MVISALTRKLLRDLSQLRSQVLAIVTVMASGVAIFVATMSAYTALTTTQADYYERYRFADVFARLVRAPQAVVARVQAIPGVAEVSARVVVDAAADVTGVDGVVTIRLVSVPRRGATSSGSFLNGVYLRRGNMPERDDEIVINEAFADATHLGPGDAMSATIHGHAKRLRVTGIGMSPEYVFAVRGTDLLPDDKHFGVVWMEEGALAAAVDMVGALNDISLTLGAGASVKEVISELDAALSPWGGLGATDRTGVMSHHILVAKFTQLRASAFVVPVVFLGVAAFLLNVVLGRLIATQRSQIGTLKAFGYTDMEVGFHYLQFVFAVVALGTACGVGVGAWLGHGLIELYRPYYRFPNLVARLDPASFSSAALIALAACGVGALGAVRRATSLPPAEAMRPEPPPAFHSTFLDRGVFRRAFSTVSRMAVRNLLRRPFRTSLAVLGISLAAAILVLGSSMTDSLDRLVSLQFEEAQRADATVTFIETRPVQAVKDLARLPGIFVAEPFRAVPVTLRHAQFEKELGVMGIPRSAGLSRLIDRDGRAIAIPEGGIVMSALLGGMLHAVAGDPVDLQLMDGSGRTRTVYIAALVDDLMGLTATMDMDELTRLVGGPPVANGAFLRADPRALARIETKLGKTEAVAAVGLREASLRSWNETFEKNMTTMNSLEVVFAVIIAFAVVYNSARVALSERARELATMRVLGFSEGEAAGVLLGELGAITAAAIPLGLWLGHAFAFSAMKASESELARIPVIIQPPTYASAAIVVLLASALSSGLVLLKIKHLDLVGVLKTRD